MPSYRKLLLIALPILAIGVVSFLFINSRDNKSVPPSTTSQGEAQINFDPPTEEDRQRAEDHKKALEEREKTVENQPQPQAGTKKTIKPTITYAGQYGAQVEVGAYVTGVFEDGGVCTAQFSKDGVSFSKKVQAVKGGNSVDCPVMSASVQEFSQKGIWSVTVNYESGTASGSSDEKVLEVK